MTGGQLGKFIGGLSIALAIGGMVGVFVHPREQVEQTTTLDQKVDQRVDQQLNLQVQTQATSTQAEQKQSDLELDLDVKKDVVRHKHTEQKPDGTIITDETEQTTYEKQDHSKQHEQEVSEQHQEVQQKVVEQAELHEHNQVDTHLTEHTKTTVGGENPLSVTLLLGQDLGQAFRGKVALTPGIEADLHLLGPISFGVGADLSGAGWVIGSAGPVGVYLSQSLQDAIHGDFRPTPGVCVGAKIVGPLGASACADLSGSATVGLTLRAF